MALSNWDLMAFGTDGKPGSGTLTIPSGASVEIYKNWLYVHSPKMWRKGGQFTKDCVSQIEHGEIRLAGFEIHAVRHPKQGAVFCYAYHCEYTGKGEKKYETHVDHHMAGVGCYGYMSSQDYLKKFHPKIYRTIDEKYWDDEKYMLSEYSSGNEWGYEWMGIGHKDHFKMAMKTARPDLDKLYTGVLPETAEAFFVLADEGGAQGVSC